MKIEKITFVYDTFVDKIYTVEFKAFDSKLLPRIGDSVGYKFDDADDLYFFKVKNVFWDLENSSVEIALDPEE